MMLVHFPDEANGGFFDTSNDHEALIHRPKNLQDNAVPSGNAVAATVLVKLSLLHANSHYWELAERSIGTMAKFMGQYPSGFGQWLQAATFMRSEPREIALVGNEEELAPLLEVLRSGYRPFQVVAAGPEGETTPPLLKDRPKIDDKGTAYVCRQFVCQAPVTEPGALAAQLG
jgi:uncharacterized protein YyaL (SSP411 family)